MDLNIQTGIMAALNRNEAVRVRGIKYPRSKVVTVSIGDTHCRIKVTPSLAIAVRDTNTAFMEALFPDFVHDYKTRRDSEQAIEECISIMRIKMEMRITVVEDVFKDPQSMLSVLADTHEVNLKKLFRKHKNN